ncbi:MAG: DUF58 domain-containing protein, partial [Chloroflexi bacterium]|nr:DUF58 domain-containing protein [Chloroflexota bacterium]
EEMMIVGGSNFRVIWKWPGARSYDLSYSVLCPKRGSFVLSKTAWEGEDPLRLRNRTRGFGDSELEIAVVPRLLGISRIGQVRARAVSPYPNADPAQTGVATTDFLELRAYAHGDPVKSINWKASARQASSGQNLLVNKYQMEGRRAIWIFLDGAEYMAVGTTLSNPFEQALEAAFSIAQFYLSRGYTLGAYVYNSPGGFLSPDVGQKQLLRLKQMLVSLEPSSTAEPLLAAIERCKHSMFHLQPETVIITRLDAYFARATKEHPSFDSLREGVKRLTSTWGRRRLRRPVWLVSVGGFAFQTRETAIEAQTSDLIRWEVQPLARQLRRVGAAVLQWDPSREAFATVLLRHLHTSKVT